MGVPGLDPLQAESDRVKCHSGHSSDRSEPRGSGTYEGIYDQFHTDMSPGGYWLHTSVALATTPLLLKKIFM